MYVIHTRAVLNIRSSHIIFHRITSGKFIPVSHICLVYKSIRIGRFLHKRLCENFSIVQPPDYGPSMQGEA